MIGILKVGYGNTQSIKALIDRLGYDFIEITDELSDFNKITHLIIPGVGSYAQASELFHNSNLAKEISEFINQKKPVLGICLGMQILTSIGHEYGKTKGLNIVGGETILLEGEESSILPHMGWNTVNFTNSHHVFQGIKNGVDFYFAHSYAIEGVEEAYIYGQTFYNKNFPSIIIKDNVIGVQFHPEKSLKNGIKLMDNFCQWDGSTC
ncbi:MAG: imidazole glycerol phosphate synthase subunit HisH [Candidatus Paracaedibacteraceae bacterium]|nr:imidazole glycerol phosphate synthase subunit HisH [Candidatus Paracaedibacteraceae bacterium]